VQQHAGTQPVSAKTTSHVTQVLAVLQKTSPGGGGCKKTEKHL
jgi:hypothetical protein